MPGHTSPLPRGRILERRSVGGDVLIRISARREVLLSRGGSPSPSPCTVFLGATGDLEAVDRLQRAKMPDRVWTALARNSVLIWNRSLGQPCRNFTDARNDRSDRLAAASGIDKFITSLTRLTFDGAWATRVIHECGWPCAASIESDRAALIDNKRAVARPKDLATPNVDAARRTARSRMAIQIDAGQCAGYVERRGNVQHSDERSREATAAARRDWPVGNIPSRP